MSSFVNTQLWRNLRRSGFRKYDFGLWQSYAKLKSRKRSEWTSSHHRKMMFEGDWGCCPNKRTSKSSKQGPVYTACQFVKGQNIILSYFYFRKISLSNLWPICPQAEILFCFFELVPNLGTSNFEGFFGQTCSWFGNKWNNSCCTSRQIGESYLYSRRVVGDFTFRQFVGKLWCNFRPTWFEVVCRYADWQAVKNGTLFRLLSICCVTTNTKRTLMQAAPWLTMSAPFDVFESVCFTYSFEPRIFEFGFLPL